MVGDSIRPGGLEGLLEGTLVSRVTGAGARPAFSVLSPSGAWEESGGAAVQITTVPSTEPVANLIFDAL